MTTTTSVPADTIIGALCNSDQGDEDSIYTNYSGRYMYGATCFGVVLSGPVALARFMIELSQEDYDLALDLSQRMAVDNMGHDTIYYFPGYTIEDL